MLEKDLPSFFSASENQQTQVISTKLEENLANDASDHDAAELTNMLKKDIGLPISMSTVSTAVCFCKL